MTFQELGLNEPILRALADQGYEQPSPIQAKAIPPALTGRDAFEKDKKQLLNAVDFLIHSTLLLVRLCGRHTGG